MSPTRLFDVDIPRGCMSGVASVRGHVRARALYLDLTRYVDWHGPSSTMDGGLRALATRTS